MRRCFTLAVLLSGIAAQAHAFPLTWADPRQLYGAGVSFDIIRNGAKIGSQGVTFETRADEILATETSDILIKLAFIPVYVFHYQATSLWNGGTLDRLDAQINDNGKLAKVSARASNGKMAITGPAGPQSAAATLLPAAHWDHAVLGQSLLLNSINGKIDHISITDEGEDSVAAPEGKRPAHRFVYDGDLHITAWYDALGRWVGLDFKGSDGSDIRYVCQSCGDPPPG